jgi:thioredoxin reductase (NADPH)
MYDIIIIGGGAAGLSAATYALGKQLDIRIIYQNFGGKSGWRQTLTSQESPEQLPSADAVRSLERYVGAHADVTLRDGVVRIQRQADGFLVETFHHGTLQAHALIIATGAAPVRLAVPGADELLGQGLGYSVTTHAHLLNNKTCAVIGASSRALRGAAELSRTAEHIYLIIPSRSDMATPTLLALQQRPNVEVLLGHRVTEVVGPMNVEELVIVGEHGPRRLAVDAAFVDLGLIPHSEIVKELVQLDPEGFIRVDERNCTSTPGIFAAGDVTTAFVEQAMIAAGDGARAAMSAYDYLLVRAPQYEAEGAD